MSFEKLEGGDCGLEKGKMKARFLI